MRRAGLLLVLAGCQQFLGFDHVDPAPPDAAPDAPPPPNAFTAVAGGSQHTCGIHVDGSLWCWGHNDQGQLGSPPTMVPESITPIRAGAMTDTWLQVVAAHDHTCAIKSDHSLWCWGQNDRGDLGTGTTNPISGLHQITGTWNAVGTGGGFGCAVDTAGAMQCWGVDDKGQLGDGLSGAANYGPHVPQAVTPPSPATWQSVYARDATGCALDTTGNAWCWGENGYSQAGHDNAQSPIPSTQIQGTTNFMKLALGNEFGCGLTPDHHVLCWGGDYVGQLGDDNGQREVIPVEVSGGRSDWTDIAAGAYHACATRTDGSLWCWGFNGHDELLVDVGAGANTSTPQAVMQGPGSFVAVGAGTLHSCAIAAGTQELWCGGAAGSGQISILGSHTKPAKVGDGWAQVSSGVDVTCAVSMAGVLQCWGQNGNGNVGDNTTLARQLPVPVTGTYQSVAVGDHTCALDTSGVVWCWGYNYERGVGDGTQMDRHVPTKTAVNNTVYKQVTVSTQTVALQTSGTLMNCWGSNENGQCGISGGGAIDPAILTASYTAISAGYEHTCALPTGGGVSCWGYNGLKQLGDNTQTSRYMSAPVMNLSGAMLQVAAGKFHTCAIKADNTLWCWGDDENGELGDGSTTNSGLPVQVAGSWLAVSTGAYHTCAINTQHQLYCFGRNGSGQLGTGNFVEHRTPTAVGSDMDWSDVSAGDDHTCALKMDHSLWCWGGNYWGQLGDGTAWTTMLQRVP